MISEAKPHLRRLGRTELEVTPIGLGVMQFSGARGIWRWMFPELPQASMNTIVEAAIAGGINWFDTAEMYGRGHSERALARGLRAAGAADADVLVATKWFPLLRTARDIPHSIHDRIHALEDYSIDLYYIHQPWSLSSLEAQMAAMAELVETGLIRAIGVSNFNAEQMRRAHAALAQRGLTLAANQVKYSLLDREIERNGVLEAARELGITLVAWGPLASGLLTGKFHADGRILARTPLGRRLSLQRRLAGSIKLIETLNMIASRYDATPAQVALCWVIQVHGDRIVAIPGASDRSHAREAAGAMRLNLTQAELAELDAVSRPDRQASASLA